MDAFRGRPWTLSGSSPEASEPPPWTLSGTQPWTLSAPPSATSRTASMDAFRATFAAASAFFFACAFRCRVSV